MGATILELNQHSRLLLHNLKRRATNNWNGVNGCKNDFVQWKA